VARALATAAALGLTIGPEDGVAIQTSGGVIEAANPQAARILGLSLDQMMGRDSADQRWAAVDAEGKALRADDHPTMRAAHSGMAIRDAIMGVHRPGYDPAGQHVWLTVDAIPLPGDPPAGAVARFSVITGPRAMELRLAASERLYRFLVEHDPDMVAWQLPDTTFLWVSSAAQTLLGRDPTSMVGRKASELMHPDDIETVYRSHRDIEYGGISPEQLTLRMRHRDGSWRWMEVVGHIVRDGDGEPSQMRTAWRDVTARVAAEHERDTALQMVRSTIESSPIGIAVCREDGTFVEVNTALRTMLGCSTTDLVGSALRDFAHPRDYVDGFPAVLAGEVAVHESECRYRRGDGSWIWGHCNLVILRDDDTTRPRSLLLHLQDITERRRANDRLTHAASHDWLTGLANRKALNEHLAQCSVTPDSGPNAMIFIDVDDFKVVNDTYGHEFGDRLLAEVARRIRRSVRLQDFTARLGGDEFIVHCLHLGSVHEAEMIAARVLAALAEPYDVGDEVVRLSASIGVTASTGCAADELMEKADRAMYRAKNQGRARVEIELLG